MLRNPPSFNYLFLSFLEPSLHGSKEGKRKPGHALSTNPVGSCQICSGCFDFMNARSGQAILWNLWQRCRSHTCCILIFSFQILRSARKKARKNPAAASAILPTVDAVHFMLCSHRAYSSCRDVYSAWFSTAFFEFPTIYRAYIHRSNLNNQYDLLEKKLLPLDSAPARGTKRVSGIFFIQDNK